MKHTTTIGIDGEIMTTIYAERTLYSEYLVLFSCLCLLCFLLCIIYFFYKKQAQIQHTMLSPGIGIPTLNKHSIDYNWLLATLGKQYTHLSKDDFYEELDGIYRLYLSDQLWHDISSYSLSDAEAYCKEINFSDKHNILWLYEKIYFSKYNNDTDSSKIRWELLWELQKLLWVEEII